MAQGDSEALPYEGSKRTGWGFASWKGGRFLSGPKRNAGIWAVLLVAVLASAYFLEPWNERFERESLPFLSGDTVRGASLFSGLGCNACHPLYGIGATIGPDLAKTPNPSWNPPVRIVTEIWNHSPQMWERMKDAQLGFPRVTERKMLDLLAYLYLVRYVDEPGDPAYGKILFSSKGCLQCHTPAGSSEQAAPDLARLEGDTPIIWAQTMWNHGRAMQVGMAQRDIRWPTFQGKEMGDLLAYLQRTGSEKRFEAGLFPADPAKGAKLFREKACYSCHRINGEGGKTGPELGPRQGVPLSITQFAGLLWNHFPQMMARRDERVISQARFAEREMADLIAYLYVIRYFEPVGRVDLGREVFNKKHCSNCHGVDGHGGKDGTNLARRQEYVSAQMAYTVWTHGPPMYRKIREKSIDWPTLEEQELVDLMAFLNSL